MRQLGGWVTDLRHRYGSDLFFRTTLHIVGLQAALIFLLVVIFAATLEYSNTQVAEAVISHVAQILQGTSDTSPETLSDSIGNVQVNATLLIFLGVVALAVFFGVVLSYVTLRPARNSLESQKLFISNIAHELRTPLTIIKTLTEVELLGTPAPSTRKTFSGILEEIERASGVINNLLSLNRLLRPERMEFQNVDLRQVIDKVAARGRKVAAERGIEIVINKADFCSVWGNPVALEQMMDNLLNNALHYTPKDKHGQIRITAGPDYSGMIVFSVADNGIGIKQQDLFHIFEPFYRGDKSRVRNINKGGSGLGLAIVNEIVRTHHGKVRIQSAPGEGTVVTVFLPVAHVAPPRVLAEGHTGGEELNEVAVDFSHQNSSFKNASFT